MILFIIQMVSAAVVLIAGLFFAIKQMGRCTKASIRFAWISMTTGALGVLIAPIFGVRSPSFPETVLMVGVAIFIICERRNRDIWCRWSHR